MTYMANMKMIYSAQYKNDVQGPEQITAYKAQNNGRHTTTTSERHLNRYSKYSIDVFALEE
jgi:hypothetical protein